MWDDFHDRDTAILRGDMVAEAWRQKKKVYQTT
jgi:hypothetical protein